MTAADIGTEPDDVGSHARRRPEAGRRRWLAGVGIAVVALALAGVIVLVVARDDAGPETRTITIPAGAGERLNDDDAEDVVDPVVRLETGQELVLRNDDVRLHTLGSLTASPGGTARQVFSTEGRYLGATSLRGDGRITILVEDG